MAQHAEFVLRHKSYLSPIPFIVHHAGVVVFPSKYMENYTRFYTRAWKDTLISQNDIKFRLENCSHARVYIRTNAVKCKSARCPVYGMTSRYTLVSRFVTGLFGLAQVPQSSYLKLDFPSGGY